MSFGERLTSFRLRWPLKVLVVATAVSALAMPWQPASSSEFSISGVLVDHLGAPVANVGVKTVQSEEIVTDAEGEFTLTVPRTEHRLRFTVTDPANSNHYLAFITEAFVPDDSGQLGTIALPPTVTKTIRIVNSDGKPAADAQLVSEQRGYSWPEWLDGRSTASGAIGWSATEHFRWPRTDARGEVSFPVARFATEPDASSATPSGLPKFHISYTDPATGTAYQTDTRTATVSDGVHLVTLPEPALVSGKVVDAIGRPKAGVDVYGGSGTGRTDASGDFELQTQSGNSSLIFALHGDESIGFTTQELDIRERTPLGTVTLPKLTTKTVKVLDSSGVPVSGAVVRKWVPAQAAWPDWLDAKDLAFGDTQWKSVEASYFGITENDGTVSFPVPRLNGDPAPSSAFPSGLPIFDVYASIWADSMQTDTRASLVEGDLHTEPPRGVWRVLSLEG